MRTRGRPDRLGRGLMVVLAVALVGCTSADVDDARERDVVALSSDPVVIQVLAITEFSGQLEPQGGGAGGCAEPGPGRDEALQWGAELLGAAWDAARAENPATLTVAAGDSFGISQPLSAIFEERPTVEALSAAGLDVDTFANHNFDRGLEHTQAMVELADYAHVASNLTSVPQNLRGVSAYTVRDVGGVPVAVMALMDVTAPERVFPGSFGSMDVSDPIEAARETIALALQDGAQLVVVLAPIAEGASSEAVEATRVSDALRELAQALAGAPVALIVGGAPGGRAGDGSASERIGDILVVQPDRGGSAFAQVELEVVPATGAVRSRSVRFVSPTSETVSPDPAVRAVLEPYRQELSQRLDRVLGEVPRVLVQDDVTERRRATPIGALIADALRATYGVDIGLMNGGGIRSSMPSCQHAPADLTLRRAGQAGFAQGPPYDLVVGDVVAMLPFGNKVVIERLSGADVWELAEHGLRDLSGAWGGFAHYSGLRLVYDPEAPPGSRVCSVALDSGQAVAPDSALYTLATNDFIAQGGDGYEVLTRYPSVIRDPLTDVVSDHIATLASEGLRDLDALAEDRLLAAPGCAR